MIFQIYKCRKKNKELYWVMVINGKISLMMYDLIMMAGYLTEQDIKNILEHNNVRYENSRYGEGYYYFINEEDAKNARDEFNMITKMMGV